MSSRRPLFIASGAILLGLAAAIAWWLVSPLFLSTTIREDFPLSAKATVPGDMTQEEVEQTMAGMAKVKAEMSEEMSPTMKSAAKVKSGALRDGDAFHKGSGGATIYRLQDGSHALRLESINVTNGPDLHVILTPHPSPATREDVHARGYVDLGKLKGNIGSQNYPIPPGTSVAAQRSVVIYCVPFHVIFTVAPLQDTA